MAECHAVCATIPAWTPQTETATLASLFLVDVMTPHGPGNRSHSWKSWSRGTDWAMLPSLLRAETATTLRARKNPVHGMFQTNKILSQILFLTQYMHPWAVRFSTRLLQGGKCSAVGAFRTSRLKIAFKQHHHTTPHPLPGRPGTSLAKVRGLRGLYCHAKHQDLPTALPCTTVSNSCALPSLSGDTTGGVQYLWALGCYCASCTGHYPNCRALPTPYLCLRHTTISLLLLLSSRRDRRVCSLPSLRRIPRWLQRLDAPTPSVARRMVPSVFVEGWRIVGGCIHTRV